MSLIRIGIISLPMRKFFFPYFYFTEFTYVRINTLFTSHLNVIPDLDMVKSLSWMIVIPHSLPMS